MITSALEFIRIWSPCIVYKSHGRRTLKHSKYNMAQNNLRKRIVQIKVPRIMVKVCSLCGYLEKIEANIISFDGYKVNSSYRHTFVISHSIVVTPMLNECLS